jgi:hypothetical protein
MEIERAKKIVDLLSSKFPNQVSYLDIMNMGWHVNNHNVLSQPQLWTIAGHLNSGDFSSKRIYEIQIGYVMSDQALSYLKEIKILYKALLNFTDKKEWIPPKLEFPIIKQGKHELASYIHTKYPDIFKLCCCCENPKIALKGRKKEYKPCGYCASCRRMRSERIIDLLDESELEYFNKEQEVEILVATSRGMKKIKSKKIKPTIISSSEYIKVKSKRKRIK